MSARTLATNVFIAALAVLPFRSAAAAGSGALRVEVLVDGSPLTEYPSHGTTYVEARRGREYSLRVTNLEPVRVAVAVAVDGRNTIDAKHSSIRDARKWILEPYESVVLDGWQSSSAAAHRFVFTNEPASYAAWLGDLSNTGVIEAVSFRERIPRYAGIVADEDARRDAWSRLRREGAEAPGTPPRADSPAPRPSAEAAKDAAGSSVAPALQPREAERDLAATGFGREIDHDVVQVAFDAEDSPAASVRLRYEYRDALVRLGVLPPVPRRDPLDRRETARGFTDRPFCPVPGR